MKNLESKKCVICGASILAALRSRSSGRISTQRIAGQKCCGAKCGGQLRKMKTALEIEKKYQHKKCMGCEKNIYQSMADACQTITIATIKRRTHCSIQCAADEKFRKANGRMFTCKQCLGTFIARKPNGTMYCAKAMEIKKYCSVKCKMLARSQNTRHVIATPRYCKACHKLLMQREGERDVMFAQRKLCGTQCHRHFLLQMYPVDRVIPDNQPYVSSILKRLYPKTRCNRCPAKEKLHWHHRDRNRKNNTAENIEILCASCHSREHIGDRARASLVALRNKHGMKKVKKSCCLRRIASVASAKRKTRRVSLIGL